MVDADQVTLELLGSKHNLIELLNSSQMNEKWTIELVKIFAKICKSKITQSMLSVLALLHNSTFMRNHVPNLMVVYGSNATEENKEILAVDTAIIMKEYYQRFPTSFSDMPLDAFLVYVTKIRNMATVGRTGLFTTA